MAKNGAPRMRIETSADVNESAATSPSTNAAPAAKAPKPKVQTTVEVPSAADAPASSSAQAAAHGAVPAPKVVMRVESAKEPEAPADDFRPEPTEAAGQAGGARSFEDKAPHTGEHGEGVAAEGESRERKGFIRAVAAWVHRTFPGHEYAFYGGLLALLVALLVFVIGLWRVILIGILVVIGVALGQVLDGDPKIIRAVRSLFTSDADRH